MHSLISSIPLEILEISIFDTLFIDKYSYNIDFIYDKKIALTKTIKGENITKFELNTDLISIVNNENSGLHCYLMLYNTATKSIMTLSQVFSMIALNQNLPTIVLDEYLYNIKPFYHCGYHFHVNINQTQYTCFSFHTTKKKYSLNNIDVINFCFDDKGIKFVNSLTIIPTTEFNDYYAVLNYRKL